jgi:hydrogenase maturation protease
MIAVVGCGNTNRCDDGVGPHIERLLRAQATDARNPALRSPDVRLIDAGTDGMAAMFAARGCRSLIVIDACRSGALPGTVLELRGADCEQPHPRAFSLHDFRWDHALHAGRQIFREDFPADVVVLLIEAESVALGVELSLPVSAAASIVVERVVELVKARLPHNRALNFPA